MHELHEKSPQFARKRFLRAHDARALSLPLYAPARFACALTSVQKTFRSIGGISWECRTIIGGSSVVIQKKHPEATTCRSGCGECVNAIENGHTPGVVGVDLATPPI